MDDGCAARGADGRGCCSNLRGEVDAQLAYGVRAAGLGKHLHRAEP